MNAPSMPQWEALLSRRGILGAAKKAGWLPDGAGWKYPLFTPDGELTGIYRWKAFDSNARPKYLWKGHEGKTMPAYYLLPTTIAMIAKADGKCILASGEPDVLAFASADAGNVLCWFGEGNTPATLAADLASFGVEEVECYPDRDETGIKWAKQIRAALRNSQIRFMAYQLPGPMSSKLDINKLWQDVAFIRDKFWESLAKCEPLPLPADVLPEQIGAKWDEYHQRIADALGVKGYKDDGWSKPIKCVLKNHEHDNRPEAWAAGWHRDTNTYKCFKCGVSMRADEIAAILNIEQPKASAKPEKVQAAPRQKATGQPSIIRSWEDGTRQLLAEINGDVPATEPLLIPFSGMRKYGGFAKRIQPGKVIAVVADSGRGKTSWIETVSDFWRKSGYSGVMWGPEWQYSSYVQRAIQRAGGPSYQMVEDHKAYLSEEKRGVPEGRRSGQRLTADQILHLTHLADQISRWPGDMKFVEKMGIPIQAVIANMREVAAQYAANGKRLSFAVLDYVQLASVSAESENAAAKEVLSQFKAFCVDMQLVGLVGSQVGKADGRAAASGQKSNMHSMLYARSDVFNLVVILDRPANENGVASTTATGRIVKNSTGGLGDFPLILNPDKLAWYDVQGG